MWRKRDWKSAAATNVIVYESLSRRGGDTLHRAYGPGFAINVGNATNLLGLRRVIESRSRYGPTMAFAITEETECMMRQSLEGQAIELGWIRDKCLRAYAGRLFANVPEEDAMVFLHLSNPCRRDHRARVHARSEAFFALRLVLRRRLPDPG